MLGHITREEAAQYKARWQALNERETLELRQTSYETKLRQLEALVGSVDAMGWREYLEEEDRLGHERWRVLRERYHERA